MLTELVEAPEHRLRMHELAAKVVLSRSGLTRLVDRLEKEGFLFREPDPTDRREAFAVLTEQGRDALRKSWPVYARGISEHFTRHLGDEEARTLVEIFTRFLEAAQC